MLTCFIYISFILLIIRHTFEECFYKSKPKTKENKTEISEYLTHKPRKPETYEMKVYHYWQKAQQNVDAVQEVAEAQQTEYVDDPDITTYQVTMMRDEMQ